MCEKSEKAWASLSIAKERNYPTARNSGREEEREEEKGGVQQH